jgi:hypothetical protein
MAIAEKILRYDVQVIQTNYFSETRIIQLRLESGTMAELRFLAQRPADWLTFPPGAVLAYLTSDQYVDVYHMLQTEKPVFFTALSLFSFQVVAVHTELDLSRGEPTGEGYRDQSLEALIVQARKRASG